MGLIAHHEQATQATLSLWWTLGGLGGIAFAARYYWWRITKGRK